MLGWIADPFLKALVTLFLFLPVAIGYYTISFALVEF